MPVVAPVKMRVMFSTTKPKIRTYATALGEAFKCLVNDVPPAYPCDKERIVLLEVSAKGSVSDSVRLFCRELTKARAQNVALIIDGDAAAAENLKSILAEAGTNVIDEVLFVKCGLFGSSVSPAEKEQAFAWVDRVIANLK